MDPIAEPLSMFGAPAEAPSIDWAWADDQLRRADFYWVLARPVPHPRPVWGVWHEHELVLSLGSPVLLRQIAADPRVTVHLESSVDVVVLEGDRVGDTVDPAAIARYDAKYDWAYDAAQYGPFMVVAPTVVKAWRAAGPAGRDGFQSSARWRWSRKR